MNPKTKKLVRELLDAPYSTEILLALRRLARTGDPDAIRPIARFLDVPGIVGRKAASALISMGPCVIPEMQKRIESDDADMIRNSHRVLKHFGVSSAALPDHEPCWACSHYLEPLREPVAAPDYEDLEEAAE